MASLMTRTGEETMPLGDQALPRAFTLMAPEGTPSHVIVASPHSGQYYPRELAELSRLGIDQLRLSEDALVDRLLADLPAAGITCLHGVYARAYMDLNRAPDDIDPSAFADAPASFVMGERARFGLGVIPTRLEGIGDIYAAPLPFSLLEQRLARVHRPYHEQVRSLIEQTRAREGVSILVDCHSMPANVVHNGPDIILGDRFGTSCSPLVTATLERALRWSGLSVGRNAPYAGGFTTAAYGQPGQHQHAIQIEMSRHLYLSANGRELGAGAGRLRAALTHAMLALHDLRAALKKVW